MSYLKHNQFKLKKDLKLQKILAEQKANLTGQEQTIVKRNDAVYGDYYEILSHQEADKAKEHVLQIFRPLPAESVHAAIKRGKSKPVDNTGNAEQ